jgi:hypothetical protein
VLGPGPDDGWWDAVRVTPANRQVWRGPQVGCPADEPVRFVADLLTRDVEQLPGRYQLLGQRPGTGQTPRSSATASASALKLACTMIPGVSRPVIRTRWQLTSPSTPTLRARVTAPSTVPTS